MSLDEEELLSDELDELDELVDGDAVVEPLSLLLLSPPDLLSLPDFSPADFSPADFEPALPSDDGFFA